MLVEGTFNNEKARVGALSSHWSREVPLTALLHMCTVPRLGLMNETTEARHATGPWLTSVLRSRFCKQRPGRLHWGLRPMPWSCIFLVFISVRSALELDSRDLWTWIVSMRTDWDCNNDKSQSYPSSFHNTTLMFSCPRLNLLIQFKLNMNHVLYPDPEHLID